VDRWMYRCVDRREGVVDGYPFVVEAGLGRGGGGVMGWEGEIEVAERERERGVVRKRGWREQDLCGGGV